MSDVAEDVRYPIGKFKRATSIGTARRAELVDEIARLPEAMAAAVAGLTAEQLDTPYRAGGWTVRQVVHHVADSHMNAYVRMKLAATEDNPPVKTYEEARWAEEPEARTAPVDLGLRLLASLHERWALWLRAIGDDAFARTVQHPEWGRMSVEDLVQLYAWHCRHHVAHITSLRQRMHW